MKVKEANNIYRFLASLEMTLIVSVVGGKWRLRRHFERSEKSQNALYSCF